MEEFNVSRRFRGTVYRITIKNPDHVEKGVREITVDGAPVKGNIIPLSDKKEVSVEVIMG